MKLSKNFTLVEFTRSSTATRLKIDNTPKGQHLENLKGLVTNILQPLAEAMDKPIIVTSGYRSAKLNANIKGAATMSAHSFGFAADIKCPSYMRGDVKQFCIWIRDWLKTNKIKYDQLIYENIGGSTWVHIGWKHPDGVRQRGEVLTIRDRGTTAGIN